MRWLALLLLPLAAACQRQSLASNTWYDSAEIVCQRTQCPSCRGSLACPCHPCRASGGVKCTSCKDGKQKCFTCKGDGVKKGKKCESCDGAGITACGTCGGDMIMECAHCAGKGRIACLQRLKINEPPIAEMNDAWPLGSFEVKK